MTEERTGTIIDINYWKGAKSGYFLVLEGDDTDYFGYGSPSAEIGENVKLAVRPGAGNFSDKFEITGTERKGPQDKKTPAPLPKPAAPSNVNERILNQMCTKAATHLVANLTDPTMEENKEEVLKEINYYAKGIKKIVGGL